MKFIVFQCCDGEDGVNGVPMCNRHKCVIEVLTRNLSKTLCYKTSLELADAVVFITFDIKNPFGLHGMSTRQDDMDRFVCLFSFQ